MRILALVLTTFIVGLLIGCVGAGGFLVIPLLDKVAGLSTHQAMGTALFSFIFTGSLGAFLYWRKGSMDWGITAPLCIGAVLTSYPGALANAAASPRMLNIILAVVIVFAGAYALVPRKPAGPGSAGYARGGRLLAFFIGAGVGFACGLTGVGGPVLSVPIMLACGFAPIPTIAASQVLQIAASSVGSVGNVQNGFINFSVAWWVIALEVAGVAVGVWLAHKTPGHALKKLVSAVCILVGAYVFVSAV